MKGAGQIDPSQKKLPSKSPVLLGLATLPVSHPEEIWGQRFQLRVWSTFLNPSKILLIYICMLLTNSF